MAGGMHPTWTEAVYLNTDYDARTGQYTTYTSTYAGTGDSLGLFNLTNRYDGTGLNVEAIVDYQGNPGPVVLYVTFAMWNLNLLDTDPLLLNVYSYPASPEPPELTSPPVGSFPNLIEIPPQNYSSSPYPITLTGPATGGSVAFLLSVRNTTTDGDGFINLAAAPEPSSFLMLGTAFVVLVLCAIRRGPAHRAVAVAST